jgi:type 1 glutamine amidotransferase
MLVFHETGGFRHDSIQAGIEALIEIGDDLGLETVASDNSSVAFGPDLSSYQVIVFLNTTGDVLDDQEQLAMEAFVGEGGGFVGIHSATDTEYEWPWYAGLVGAYFAGHPAVQPATMYSTESGHPAGAGLPVTIDRVDEWYNFRAPPGPEVVILATLDESTYDGGTMGPTHPIAWAHEYQGGRSFYTAGGHTIESYAELVFTAHIAAGVEWAAGAD